MNFFTFIYLFFFPGFTEMVWQEKDIPGADAKLVVEFEFELQMLFAGVSRFWICSWEKQCWECQKFAPKQ